MISSYLFSILLRRLLVRFANHVKVTNGEILVLGFLGVLSLCTGYLFKDIFSGFGSNYFNTSVTILPLNCTLMQAEFLSI